MKNQLKIESKFIFNFWSILDHLGTPSGPLLELFWKHFERFGTSKLVFKKWPETCMIFWSSWSRFWVPFGVPNSTKSEQKFEKIVPKGVQNHSWARSRPKRLKNCSSASIFRDFWLIFEQMSLELALKIASELLSSMGGNLSNLPPIRGGPALPGKLPNETAFHVLWMLLPFKQCPSNSM